MNTYYARFTRSLVIVSLILCITSCGGKSKVDTNQVDKEKIQSLLQSNTCLACHQTEKKLIGPSFKEIATKNYNNERIVALIYKPEPANWPDYPPMMALPHIPEKELIEIAQWINSLN
ncbi:MAG: c-type cytochrome [Reichenbachiella sp.]|uniref:c-type cytochrome n=1 Tax=Reichenbachiella sp. TaxID=2184521 RepID=UPI0032653A87